MRRRNSSCRVGVHEERREGEEQEDDSADEGDRADGDALGDDAPAQDGQARAHGVAEDATDHLWKARGEACSLAQTVLLKIDKKFI